MKLVIAQTLLSFLLLPPIAAVAQQSQPLTTSTDGITIGTITYRPGPNDGTSWFFIDLTPTPCL